MFYSCILFLIDRSLIFVCVIYCFYICVPVLYDVILISCICPFIFIVITVVCLSLKLYYCIFFCFKQKSAYDVRIIDWSSDVCSSDLLQPRDDPRREVAAAADEDQYVARRDASPVLAMFDPVLNLVGDRARQAQAGGIARRHRGIVRPRFAFAFVAFAFVIRSEERRVGKEGVSTCRYRRSPYH